MALLVGNGMSKPAAQKIGIAGFIGSGKSTVAKMLQESGFTVIDADAEAHYIYATHADVRIALSTAFGPSVLTADGVDRRRLGQLVFSDPKALQQLETIIHPVLATHLIQRMASASQHTNLGAVFVEGALLPKWPSLLQILDQIWEVRAPEAHRVERIVQRGSERCDAEHRIKQQRLFPPIMHPNVIVFENHGDVQALYHQVLQELEKL